MKQKDQWHFKRITGLGITLFSVLSFQNEANGATNNENRADEKPNIIYILADDLGYGDLSCYGQEKFETPNIDRLAEEGMKFLQHYSGSTVSAPSRSVLMTGLHTGHTQIRGNQEIQPEGQAPLDGSVVTVAELLQKRAIQRGPMVNGDWVIPDLREIPIIRDLMNFTDTTVSGMPIVIIRNICGTTRKKSTWKTTVPKGLPMPLI